MRRVALPALAALVGLSLIGLVGGDPRATNDLAVADRICLTALVLSGGVAFAAWSAARWRSYWVLPPTVVAAVLGGLCGWIAGAELTGAPDTAVLLNGAPGRVAFMLAMTTLGMALPAVGLTALADLLKSLGKART
jgi:hypothetical protein